MIVDCFPFFNELDLLEIRLNELKDVVDEFVLAESPYTFTGKEKPLYFSENRKRFAGFNIEPVIYTPLASYHPMEFERHQKQFALDAAFWIMSEGDVLISGDVDEIPKASVIEMALQDEWQSAGLVMTLYYYFMNCRSTKKKVRRDSRLVKFAGRFDYNLKQNDPVEQLYYDAGWHFSFLGDVKEKIAAWGHAPEYDKPPFNDPAHIRECIENGKDVFMRRGMGFEYLDDLGYLPQYVLNNMDKFKDYIK